MSLRALRDRATELHKKGRLAEAERLYGDMLEIDAADLAARHQLGVLRFQQGRCAEALADFDRVVVEKPTFVEAWYNRGVTLATMNRHAEALVSFGKVLALEPDHPRAHGGRGETLWALKKPQDALASFARALAIAPDDAELLYKHGTLLAERGREREAIENFDLAIAVAPNYADALYNRGLVLAGLKRFAEALASFEAILQIHPDHFEALYNRGIALWHLKRPSEALETFDKVLAIDPGFAPGWNNRGNVLHDLLRLDEAIASYRRALEINPNYADAQRNLGQPLCEIGRIEEGLAAFRRHADMVHGAAAAAQDILPSPQKARHDREQRDYLRADEALQTMGESPFHIESGARVFPRAVNPADDDVATQWRTSKPQIVVIDNLLTDDALEKLRRFCWRSTIWQAIFEEGYLGAFPYHGFACPLLAQIAGELRDSFPAIFGAQPLLYLWAFKYDSQLSGIKVHADFATVNVNFWITPDEANLDPESGGLIVWDTAAPPDWDFSQYNGEAEPIRDFLARSGAKSMTVPYRANRAVIFNSDLFHETDRMSFKPGYENRRINVTMLYGRRSKAINRPGSSG